MHSPSEQPLTCTVTSKQPNWADSWGAGIVTTEMLEKQHEYNHSLDSLHHQDTCSSQLKCMKLKFWKTKTKKTTWSQIFCNICQAILTNYKFNPLLSINIIFLFPLVKWFIWGSIFQVTFLSYQEGYCFILTEVRQDYLSNLLDRSSCLSIVKLPHNLAKESITTVAYMLKEITWTQVTDFHRLTEC